MLFNELVIRSWWAILFALICFFAYDQAMHRKNKEHAQLEKKFSCLLTKKTEALERQEELQLHSASQSDEAWIEMVLMQRLGLVPEKQRKVLFITNS